MAKPIIEAKWQADKAIAAVNELDSVMQELDYRLGEAIEAQEQLEAFEAKKENIESLAQQALVILEDNADDLDQATTQAIRAINLIQDLIKELQ